MSSKPDTVAVFFYGLFMDERLLASRGIFPSSTAIGYVEGYGIRIGSRATLIPDEGNRAHGVLMMMKASDVETLYSDEGLADYVAESVSVVLADGTARSALCYNLPEYRLEGANVEYARALRSLAGDLGLAADYIDQIKAQEI